MRILWEVNTSEWKDGNLYLLLEETPPLNSIDAGERMLAHSDDLSFIYILEQDDQYIYLVIPHTIWNQLKQAADQKSKFFLKGKDQDLELLNLGDELDYIVKNIEGNSNYGKEMVSKVEAIFMNE